MNFKRYWILLTLLGVLAACSAVPQEAFTPPEITLDAPDGGLDAPLIATPQVDPGTAWALVERVLIEEGDSPPYEIDARWPNLEADSASAAVFNTEINRRVDATIASFLADLSETGDGFGTPPVSFLALEYVLTYQDHGLVSVYLLLDTYIALSAHPFPSSQSLNFDLGTGRFLTLADLFAPDVDPLAVILPVVEPDLVARDLGFTPGLAEGVLQAREHWNLLPEGLRINFDVYEVAPYAAGPQTVLIPWDRLAADLNPDGPLRHLFTD